MSDEAELAIAWHSVVGGAPSGRAAEVFDDVVARHRQPQRHYHGLRHVVWVVRHIGALADDPRTPPIERPVALAAAFFHDAVYDPVAADNETRSAELAARQLASLTWDDASIDAVFRIIVATAGHFSDDASTSDATTDVVLDADLAVLGADPAGYDAYSRGVRREYGHLADDEWRTGRSAVLAALLDRVQLYRTLAGRERWDDRARANLTSELAQLSR